MTGTFEYKAKFDTTDCSHGYDMGILNRRHICRVDVSARLQSDVSDAAWVLSPRVPARAVMWIWAQYPLLTSRDSLVEESGL